MKTQSDIIAQKGRVRGLQKFAELLEKSNKKLREQLNNNTAEPDFLRDPNWDGSD